MQGNQKKKKKKKKRMEPKSNQTFPSPPPPPPLVDATTTEDDGDEGRYHHQLKNGGEDLRTQNPDGTFRCPFCPEKKKQNYLHNEILQHATGVGSSSSRPPSVSASHRALATFLLHLAPPTQNPNPPPQQQDDGACDDDDDDDDDDRFVYPWTGVLANIPTKLEPGSGRRVGESGSKLREQLARFCPVHVRPVWSYLGHSGYALVEFTKDWKGFHDAMAFHRHYEAGGFGKKAWVKGKSTSSVGGMEIYGWIAKAADFNYDGPVGQQMRKKGELTTVDELSMGVMRKKEQLVAKLEEQIDERDRHVEALKVKYSKHSLCLGKMMEERKKRLDSYNLEVQNMRSLASDHSRKIIKDNANLRLELETKCNQLDALVTQTNTKKRTLDNEHGQLKSKMIALQHAALQQKKADGNVMELLKEQKKEKEAAFEKILQLEKQLDMKQQLELEIEQLRGRAQILARMGGESDVELKEKVSKLNEELQEKIEEMEHLDAMNQTLVVKERSSRDELQEAQKELILVLSKMETNMNSKIQVKMMGELDIKPFLRACKERFGSEDHEFDVAKIHSMWQEEIKSLEWRPYKMVIVDGKPQDVIDEDDPKLKQLKASLGDEVHEAVCTALLEVNGVDGKYVSPVIWNKSGRKATLGEALHFLLDKWKSTRKL